MVRLNFKRRAICFVLLLAGLWMAGKLPAAQAETNYLPIGNMDAADSTQVRGWAYDRNSGAVPVKVIIYVDELKYREILADVFRSDLVGAYKGLITEGTHGFNVSLTGLSVGRHSIKAVAVNNPAGLNAELPGSPKIITVTNEQLDGDQGNPDQIVNQEPQSPFPGPNPHLIPGRIEAENFDRGGNGTAYNDLSAGNIGNVYRTNENVDLGTNTIGGYHVANTQAGEWLEYSVDVSESSLYNIEVSFSSLNSSNFHIEMDGQNITQAMSGTGTGGWQNWALVRRNSVNLSAGKKVIRLVFDGPASGSLGNIDYIRVVKYSDENYLPIGNFDAANQTTLRGWAFDRNAGSAPIHVHVYIDGVSKADVVADEARTDLVGSQNGLIQDPDHGWSYVMPKLSVGPHVIRVYAINTPQGRNPELSNSPRTITAQDGVLSARWTFDAGDVNGATVRDVSLNGYHGALIGAPAQIAGKMGEARRFNGTDQAVSLPVLEFRNKSFSISAWLNPSTTIPEAGVVYFGARSNSTENESLHLRIYQDGRIRFGFYSDDLDTPAGSIRLGEWHQVTVTYDNGTDMSKIYVDGNLKASGQAGPFSGTAPQVSIGRWFDGNVQYFNGGIDDVRLYPKALSGSEIGNLAGKQSPFPGPNPHSIPGVVQAENYDFGGQDIAYFDEDATCNGSYKNRGEGVDLDVCTEGGLNVGWIAAGEWIEYTVNVANAGTYNVKLRYAANTGFAGAMHIEFKGQDKTGVIETPSTGGWQSWSTITGGQAVLEKGTQIMRIAMDPNDAATNYGFNLNFIQFDYVSQVTNNLPVGNLDVANATRVSGWAYDQDAAPGPILVHIYVDDVMLRSEQASLARTDLVGAYYGTIKEADHGFNYALEGLSPGTHTVRVYAINVPAGTNPELSGSPKTFTIAEPPVCGDGTCNGTETCSTCAGDCGECSTSQATSNAVLTWNANTESDLAGYKIYYGTSPRTGSCPAGGYPSVVTSAGSATTYTVTGLTAGQTYYFSITAYDTSGNESCFSAEVTKAIPAAVSCGDGTCNGTETCSSCASDCGQCQTTTGNAVLTWNANTESDLAGYKIYYGTSPRTGSCPAGGYPSVVTSAGSATTYTVTGLTAGQTYYFSITSYDTSGNESCFSAEVTKSL